MKKIINLSKLILVACCIFIVTSCSKGEPITIRAQFSSAHSHEQQAKALDVIRERLKELYKTELTQPLANGEFVLNVYSKGDTATPITLLTKRGELYITETYEAAQIFRALIQADQTLADSINSKLKKTEKELSNKYPLFSIFQLSVDNEGKSVRGPLLGMSDSKDTATVNALLSREEIKALFPNDILFMWTALPTSRSNESIYSLIAVKTSQQSLYLNSQTTESMKRSSSQQGYEEILITLKESEESSWAEMTRKNIGRSLAIISDNEVMSYPRVQSEITGGKSSITGDFKKEELDILVAIFKGGILDCPVESWYVEHKRVKELQ